MIKTEAATLPKKKNSISKVKVKKSIRNVLCAPDPVVWLEITDEHGKIIELELEKYKVEIPEYQKSINWKILKDIPKNERPKAPKIPRVEGLIFGITEVDKTLQSDQCSAMVVNSSVNPRTLVLPLIEQCISKGVPTICLKDLKKITSANFGIPTSCLGIKTNCLEDLQTKINEIMRHYYTPPVTTKMSIVTPTPDIEINDVQETTLTTTIASPYLYRTNKRIRVFNPSSSEQKTKKAFVGQDFIEFTSKPEQNTGTKTYMASILKKIRNVKKDSKINKQL